MGCGITFKGCSWNSISRNFEREDCKHHQGEALFGKSEESNLKNHQFCEQIDSTSTVNSEIHHRLQAIPSPSSRPISGCWEACCLPMTCRRTGHAAHSTTGPSQTEDGYKSLHEFGVSRSKNGAPLGHCETHLNRLASDKSEELWVP